MRVRTAAPLALAALVAVGAPAQAAVKAKPKPQSKTYNLTLAPSPDASEATGCSGPTRTDGVNMDVETIKVTGPGLLSVEVTGFSGDWDTSVYNAAGSQLTEGGGTGTPPADPTATGLKEVLKYKNKKAQTLSLRVCNFLGSPNATVKYTFVYS
jgi:type 1 fimbria pilin